MSSHSTKDSKILFEVYGDESINGEVVAFGLAIAPVQKISLINEEIRRVKKEFSAEGARIHCKEILHGDQRKRSPWKHLSQDEVFSMLINISRSAYLAGIRAWVGFLDSRSVPKQMVFEGDGDGKIEIMNITDLHLLLFSYWTAIGPIFDFLPHQRTRGWMDPNKSKVKLLDKNKQIRRAQGFFPLHHNGIRFEPSPINSDKPALLDIADMVAHCAARALSVTTHAAGKERYESILYELKPGLSVAHFNLVEGSLLSVEAKSTAISEFRNYFQEFSS